MRSKGVKICFSMRSFNALSSFELTFFAISINEHFRYNANELVVAVISKNGAFNHKIKINVT